jgi:hypothetical protein
LEEVLEQIALVMTMVYLAIPYLERMDCMVNHQLEAECTLSRLACGIFVVLAIYQAQGPNRADLLGDNVSKLVSLEQ